VNKMNQQINIERRKSRSQNSEEEQTNIYDQCLEKTFTHLTKEQKTAISKMMIPVKFREGDLIFQEGALADGIYFICRGFAVYGKGLGENSSRKRIFKLLGPGDLLGEETIFGPDPEPRFGYARAIVETGLMFLEKTSLIEFLEDQPRLFQDLCSNMTSRLKGLEEKLLHEGYLTTDRRLANLLIKVRKKLETGGQDEDSLKCLKLSRKTLAQILGVSKGSITKSLRKLENKKLITLKDENICLESREGLMKFAEK